VPRLCSAEDCVGKHKAYGLCQEHYQRWRRYGEVPSGSLGLPHLLDCSVAMCGRPQISLGWCTKHLSRWRKFGNPMAGRTPEGSGLAWIREMLRTYEGGCELGWPYGFSTGGYPGEVSGFTLAGYLVLDLTGRPRPDPPGNFLLHSCDFAACLAPDHIRWGTQQENIADAVARGRNTFGECSNFAKLTETDVIDIRVRYAAGGVLQRELAAEYGVQSNLISRIITGKIWKHLL
jgi:hypothetical protein